MLTADLVRVRRTGDLVTPRYLDGAVKARLLPAAAELCACLPALVGRRRVEVELALEAVAVRPADRPILLGLRKLLLDRAKLAVAPGPDPEALRAPLFAEAARVRRHLDLREPFDRRVVLERVAAELSLDAGTLEARLFADLKENERLVSWKPIEPDALLDRYDLALAQAVLMSATRVTLDVGDERAAHVRRLFTSARFHGLLHQVHERTEGGYRIEIDGPLSLFGAAQRYGLRLALFLPSVLALEHFALEAELRWGPRKTGARFRLAPGQGLRADRGVRLPRLPPVLVELCRRFGELDTPWRVAATRRIFAVPGEDVCVPDLEFRHPDLRAPVYLEAFGFWSRAAVWRRLEQIERGLDEMLVLAVGKQLRVSEELLDETDVAELYVYRETMSPRAVLAKLEAIRGRRAARAAPSG